MIFCIYDRMWLRLSLLIFRRFFRMIQSVCWTLASLYRIASLRTSGQPFSRHAANTRLLSWCESRTRQDMSNTGGKFGGSLHPPLRRKVCSWELPERINLRWAPPSEIKQSIGLHGRRCGWLVFQCEERLLSAICGHGTRYRSLSRVRFLFITWRKEMLESSEFLQYGNCHKV